MSEEVGVDASNTHWPEKVRPISWDAIGKLGFHQVTGELYWDGKKVETSFGLSRRNEIIAWVVAGATVVMAVVDILRFFRGG